MKVNEMIKLILSTIIPSFLNFFDPNHIGVIGTLTGHVTKRVWGDPVDVLAAVVFGPRPFG